MITAGILLHQQIEAAGWIAWVGTGLFLGMLIYQHLLVKPNDLSRVNMAFATTNGFASVCFGLLTIIDLLF
jgi:4-hydroxybenzoate polyprenyltransferase